MSVEELLIEEWKPIKGFEHYEISNLGRVRKIAYLRQNKTKASSYLFIQLFKGDGHGQKNKFARGEIKKVNIHRLVAEHFLDNPHSKPQVNHIDGNKLNNSVDNLEWVTRHENMQHAYDSGLAYQLKGPQSAKRVKQISKTGEVLKIWNGVKELVENGFTKAKIYGACGQGHTYRNCYWNYTNDYIDYNSNKVFRLVEGKREYEAQQRQVTK